MIDIHSHILPGVDDGARTMDEALTMLKMAADDGVETQILTPHIHYGRFENTFRNLVDHFFELSAAAEAENIPITLMLSAELRIGAEIMKLVENKGIPWLINEQGIKTLLLELPLKELPHGSENLVRWLRQKGIRPILVHPERNRVFQQQPDKLQPFINLGCPIQITASSLTGRFGDGPQEMAEQLLKQGKVDILASDCHNLTSRPPNLSLGVQAAAKIVGSKKAWEMVTSFPRQLIGSN